MSAPAIPARYNPERAPLGLPPGSVRALLTLAIVGLFLTQVCQASPGHKVPLYVHLLMALVFVFFASHGKSIAGDGRPGPSPLYLPRGVLRLALIAGLVGVIVWQALENPQQLLERLTPSPNDVAKWPYLSGAMIGGFLLGWLLSRGPWRRNPAFQDVQAWLSLVTMGVLAAELLIQVFVKSETHFVADRVLWESILVGVIAFYFGARS